MYRSLRLLTFDVTNTLITVASDIGVEYAKVATIYGLKDVTDPAIQHQISTAFRVHFKRLNIELPNFGAQAGLTPVQWWTRLVISTFTDAGVIDETPNQKKLQSTAAHLYKLYSRGSQWSLVPGATDLLFDLRAHKPSLALGLVSNFDPRLETILRDLGLTHYFKYIFTSSQVGLAKPNPDLFRHVLSEAGIIDPSAEYLHIGDNTKLDFNPVLEVGGRAIIINKTQNPTQPAGTLVPTLNHLRPLLELPKQST